MRDCRVGYNLRSRVFCVCAMNGHTRANFRWTRPPSPTYIHTSTPTPIPHFPLQTNNPIPPHPTHRLIGLLAGYRESGVRLIAVDYTHPTAVNPNAKLYARHKLDFVMVGRWVLEAEVDVCFLSSCGLDFVTVGIGGGGGGDMAKRNHPRSANGPPHVPPTHPPTPLSLTHPHRARRAGTARSSLRTCRPAGATR